MSYTLLNKTTTVQEIEAKIEQSDDFMFAGSKEVFINLLLVLFRLRLFYVQLCHGPWAPNRKSKSTNYLISILVKVWPRKTIQKEPNKKMRKFFRPASFS